MNVVSVEHHREGLDVPVSQTEVELTLAMRDRAHGDASSRRCAAWATGSSGEAVGAAATEGDGIAAALGPVAHAAVDHGPRLDALRGEHAGGDRAREPLEQIVTRGCAARRSSAQARTRR